MAPPYNACNPSAFPNPVDLSHHISRSTIAREASQVKRFYKYFQIPGIAQLAGGRSSQLHRYAKARYDMGIDADDTRQACQTTTTSRTTRSKPGLPAQIDGSPRPPGPSSRPPSSPFPPTRTVTRLRRALWCPRSPVSPIHFA